MITVHCKTTHKDFGDVFIAEHRILCDGDLSNKQDKIAALREAKQRMVYLLAEDYGYGWDVAESSEILLSF